MGNRQSIFSSSIYEWRCYQPDFTKHMQPSESCFGCHNKPRGDNYVFWGGREALPSLNTNMKKELDHLAIFYQKLETMVERTGLMELF